jgi:nucleoside-diphosphate-sugar epimerase
MRAIVTGGAGFIGSHLSEKLVERNYEVAIWDNLFRGKIENIEHILNSGNQFTNIDLSKNESVSSMSEMILRDKPEFIYHYAAINGTQYFYDMPAKVLEANAMATHNLMIALRVVKSKSPNYNCKLIYSSSSEVYGEPFSLPTKETDVTWANISKVRDSYAISKLVGEFYVKLIAEELGMQYLILRLFNVYGPRMIGTKYGQVVPEFIQRLSDGEYPLNIFGNGKNKRSFCYVADNVSATIDLAESDTTSGVYNIGNSEEISIIELGKLVMENMNKEPKFCFLPERDGDHMRRCPDTSKLHSVIGARNYISLTEGIRLMM